MLDDELRSQQTKCDHCLECGIQILEKTPADSEHAADINNRLDSLSNNWNNLESLIKVMPFYCSVLWHSVHMQGLCFENSFKNIPFDLIANQCQRRFLNPLCKIFLINYEFGLPKAVITGRNSRIEASVGDNMLVLHRVI